MKAKLNSCIVVIICTSLLFQHTHFLLLFISPTVYTAGLPIFTIVRN